MILTLNWFNCFGYILFVYLLACLFVCLFVFVFVCSLAFFLDASNGHTLFRRSTPMQMATHCRHLLVSTKITTKKNLSVALHFRNNRNKCDAQCIDDVFFVSILWPFDHSKNELWKWEDKTKKRERRKKEKRNFCLLIFTAYPITCPIILHPTPPPPLPSPPLLDRSTCST